MDKHYEVLVRLLFTVQRHVVERGLAVSGPFHDLKTFKYPSVTMCTISTGASSFDMLRPL